MVRTGIAGIFQSDILIRTAIIEALDDLRRNPWLLDYVFAWLISDDLTRQQYGEKELQEAKDWFLNNQIAVSMAYRTDRPQLPCIGIELLDSSEANSSLGDTHYEPKENVKSSELLISPKPLLGPFTPKSYDSNTGVVTLPDGLTTDPVWMGMLLYDPSMNKPYVIKEVLSSATFLLETKIKANFNRSYIAPRDSFWTVPLHSLFFRESYRLTAYVQAKPAHLLFLHSIMVFILLRYKESLLEKRGFENFTLSSNGFSGSINQDDTEVIFSRSITVSGLVKQYWPGEPSSKIDGVAIVGLRVASGSTPVGILPEVDSQGWGMEEDALSFPNV